MIILASSIKKGGVPEDALVLPNSDVINYNLGLYGSDDESVMAILSGIYDVTSLESAPFKKIIGTPAVISFYNYANIKELPEMDLSRITDLRNCFYYCAELKEVDLIKLNFSDAGVSTLSSPYDGTFYGCESLERINGLRFISGRAFSEYEAFKSCYSLTDVTNIVGTCKLAGNLDMHDSPLSEQSLLNFAFAFENGSSGTFKLNNATANATVSKYVKLNDDQTGLIVCDQSDPDNLGTFSQYLTGKGITITLM